MNSFDLSLSLPIQQVPTYYLDKNNNTNSDLDLFFLQSSSMELNNHNIFPELWFPSNHTPLIVNIIINKIFIQDKRHIIVKNSQEEIEFLTNLIKGFRNIDTSNIPDNNSLKCIVQEYARLSELIWLKHLCLVNITRQSKNWWNEDYQVKLTAYRSSKRVKEWRDFRRIVKTTKHIFFWWQGLKNHVKKL